MAKNLVDADTFTAAVNVPESADPRTAASVETPFQALTNRTYNNKLRLDAKDTLASAFSTFSLSASALANNGECTIAEVSDPNTLFSVASNKITVPSAGWYRVDMSGRLSTTDATDNVELLLNLELEFSATSLAPRSRRFTTSDISTPFAISGIVEVANASHRFGVTNKSGIAISLSGGVLVLQRIL